MDEKSQRIAIVGTPRSGNTWLRMLIASACELEPLAIHFPENIDWPNLPRRCVLQIHWPREDAFEHVLRENGFRAVVLSRHPLDVLISILQLAQNTKETAHWLRGAGGNESRLVGASPLDPAFADYAVSERARLLLDVTTQWLQSTATIGLRYEDLVADTKGIFSRLLDQAGLVPRKSIDAVIESAQIGELRSRNHAHFWQGKPGLWRSLLPPSVAGAIAQAHRPLLELNGYDCEPDPSLTADRAGALWYRLRVESLKRDLDRKETTLAAALTEIDACKRVIDQITARCLELQAFRDRFDAIDEKLFPTLAGLGRWTTRLVHGWKTLVGRHNPQGRTPRETTARNSWRETESDLAAR